MTANGTLTKLSARTAAEVCQHFSLGDEARTLLRESQTPGQYLDLLIEKHQHLDAVRFLAHALPKREAVWWACLCARSVAGANPAPGYTAALQAAETWVADPSEDYRRAAMAEAEKATFGNPAGCAAAAVFFSGGSLGPPNVPAIPPGEHLTARSVAGGILLAAVTTAPETAPEKYRQFLARGKEVASGVNRWPETAARAETAGRKETNVNQTEGVRHGNACCSSR
jgi:hypothetical protein